MALASQNFEVLIKILIVGDSAVGKTCMLLRYCDDRFSMSHLPTIGIDFKIKKLEIDDLRIKMQIWDTAGQERFKTITQSYFKGAHGIILTYSCDDKDSLLHIDNWVRQTSMHAPPDIIRVLVGNKCDVIDRTVSYEEGKSVADEYGIPFFETSAKEGTNIEETFLWLAKTIKERLSEKEKMGEPELKDGKQLVSKTRPKDSRVCC